jgi:hypothetical protein
MQQHYFVFIGNELRELFFYLGQWNVHHVGKMFRLIFLNRPDVHYPRTAFQMSARFGFGNFRHNLNDGEQTQSNNENERFRLHVFHNQDRGYFAIVDVFDG